MTARRTADRGKRRNRSEASLRWKQFDEGDRGPGGRRAVDPETLLRHGIRLAPGVHITRDCVDYTEGVPR